MPSARSNSSAKPAATEAPRNEDIKGSETPRLATKPRRELTPETSAGFSAITFAEEYLKLRLYPWQKWFLIHALELNADGYTLRFRTVLLLIARQNGKSAIVNVLALWRMFVDGAETILSTAQDLGTAEQLWQEAISYIENDAELKAQLKKVAKTNGNKVLHLTEDRMWKVGAANRSAGRGLSVDELIMDELREQMDEEAFAALSNTTIARAGSQIVGMSNAGDEKSVLLNRLRAQALEVTDDPDTTIAIFEWSAPEGDDIDDPRTWAKANPSMGHGPLTIEVLRAARQRQTANKFRTENLCQTVATEVTGPWDEGTWESLADPYSEIAPGSEVTISVDTGFDRQATYITIAGWRADGNAHIETIAQRTGNIWVVPLLTKHWKHLGASNVLIQGAGSNATELIEPLQAAGIPVTPVKGSDLGGATGMFLDAVKEGRIRHRGQQLLNVAASAAQLKQLGQVRVFDDRSSPVEVAPLQAGAFAYWGLTVAPLRNAAPTTSIYETEALAWA